MYADWVLCGCCASWKHAHVPCARLADPLSGHSSFHSGALFPQPAMRSMKKVQVRVAFVQCAQIHVRVLVSIAGTLAGTRNSFQRETRQTQRRGSRPSSLPSARDSGQQVGHVEINSVPRPIRCAYLSGNDTLTLECTHSELRSNVLTGRCLLSPNQVSA